MVLLVTALSGCSERQPVPPPVTAADRPQAPTATAFDYQLGGDYPLPPGVDMVVRQWLDGEAAADTYSVCYVNAFQTEADPAGPDGENAWPAGTVWTGVEDPAWPGEHPIDIGSVERREDAAAFVRTRFAACAERGFDAVELDNLDTYTRYDDAPFDRDDTIAYASLLVDEAESLGLAVGQKNTTDLLDVGPTTIGFAFAVVEECGAFDECRDFTDAYGAAVFDIEYTTEGFSAACAAIGDVAAVIHRDLDLTTPADPAYVFDTC